MKRIWWITISVAAVGALTGWLYWRYVGCSTGACSITSDPLHCTLYGTLMGGLVGNTLGDRGSKRSSTLKNH